MVPGDRFSVRRCLRASTLYFVAVFAYGIVALWLMRHQLEPDPTLTGMLRTVFAGLVGAEGAYEYTRSFWPAVFELSLLMLGTLGGVIAAIMLFRPYVHRHCHDPADYASASSSTASATTRSATSPCVRARHTSSRATAVR